MTQNCKYINFVIRLPDESVPTIPEDDPDYYGKVHDPHT